MTSRDRIKTIRNQPRTMQEKRELRYGHCSYLGASVYCNCPVSEDEKGIMQERVLL